MSYPTTIEEMKEQGYKFSGEGECRSCGADIEWWETPRGKKMPTDHGTATPHWSTCPSANEHRNQNASQGEKMNLAWLKEQAKGCHCNLCEKVKKL